MPYIKDISKEYTSKEKFKAKKKLISPKEESQIKKQIKKIVYDQSIY